MLKRIPGGKIAQGRPHCRWQCWWGSGSVLRPWCCRQGVLRQYRSLHVSRCLPILNGPAHFRFPLSSFLWSIFSPPRWVILLVETAKKEIISYSQSYIILATTESRAINTPPITLTHPTNHAQARDRDGMTCLHHALSLPDPSPAASAWIAAALALPDAAELHKIALSDITSGSATISAHVTALELYRGDVNAAQVMLIACQA
jgi:hypothetical protein